MPASAPAEPPPSRSLRSLALPFYGVVALFAFGYALFSDHLEHLFGERLPTWTHMGLGLGLGIVLIGVTRATAAGWRPMGRARDALVDLVGPVGWGDAVLLALLSGLAEELLFRGALWPHLGLAGTTLLFGLVHVLPRWRLWVYPLFATVAGLVLGILRQSTASIWPSVLAHVTVNAVNLIWLGSLARRRLREAA
ncbi:MAG: lysostaphin resistance A-like protein [Planctomycetota bacterium]|jgi:membrane protease YdiL (CAAX protease family)